MEEMRPVDILANLNGWDYDISCYPMPKAEAEVCKKALEHIIELENKQENDKK